MVERIVEFSARNHSIVFLLIFGLVGGELWALKQTSIDALPDISDTQVILYPSKWDARPIWRKTRSPTRNYHKMPPSNLIA